MKQTPPPQSREELMLRCKGMAGKTLGQIAENLETKVPQSLTHNKGWIGQLIEHYLGADAGSYAEPDFTSLGIEMKTLPLDNRGLPKESTYVCMVNLQQSGRLKWEDSWLKQKLANVLWVPIEADRSIPIADRFIGVSWLWQPSLEQIAVLKRDWEELMDRVVLGEQSEITAKEGEYLQIRPKAANSKIRVKGSDAQGNSVLMNPKGFYLRSSFTSQLLAMQQI